MNTHFLTVVYKIGDGLQGVQELLQQPSVVAASHSNVMAHADFLQTGYNAARMEIESLKKTLNEELHKKQSPASENHVYAAIQGINSLDALAVWRKAEEAHGITK